MTLIAIIADPHVHDCSWQPTNSGLSGAIRSFAETAASTRVFNESIPAFRAALDRAVAEGATLALIVGDLTDDGQAPNIDAALDLLAHYRQHHGLRVLATPGNHDFYALAGRPQIKTFLAPDGAAVIVDSADAPDAATMGTQTALEKMAHLGYLPEPQDLHWETPFGTDPRFEARSYDVPSPDGQTQVRMIDASYLVEPIAGVWVLALDANICAPRNGATDFGDPKAFHDPTDGGWAAVIRHRAHLLTWMADVARRAQDAGKQLIAFSHYPVLDPLGGASADEVAIFGATGLARRAPPPEAALAFAATGVPVHFSGHLHVNDTAQNPGKAGFLNLATPSPVGFPPAMKLAQLDPSQITIRTLHLDQVPGHDLAYPAYQREADHAHRPHPNASYAVSHGAFMNRHLAEVVNTRYIPREWPPEMAAFTASKRMPDLLDLLKIAPKDSPDIPLTLLAEDWYRLRKAADLAQHYIPAERLAFYKRLTESLPDTRRSGGLSPANPQPKSPAPDSLAGLFLAFLRILSAYLARLPNGDFTIDLKTMAVTAL